MEKIDKKTLHNQRKIEKRENALKKWKARIIEQEKTPELKAYFFKLTPEELEKYLREDAKNRRSEKRLSSAEFYKNNSIDKGVYNSLEPDSISKVKYKRYMNNKSWSFHYFWGVGKERRRIRWESKENLKTDTIQTLVFIIIFAAVFAVVDLFITMLRYFHVIQK